MSTNYFIMGRPKAARTDNNQDNQIIHINSDHRQIFLLPTVNLDYYWKKGLFECQLIEWSKQFCKKDKVFLDIGAHTGTYSISLAPYSKSVVAFEPQKNTYYALCGSVALSGLAYNIECVACGLGSEEQVGQQTLRIVSNDGGGSSLLHSAENASILREEQITVKTLDSLEIKDVGFIKMDVEDNELNVLRGGLNTLRESGYPSILFESNQGGENGSVLFGFLREALGYKVIPVRGCSNMFLACRD